jgi:hypothetical protein
MLAGFLIAVPMLLTAYAAQTDRLPHKIVLIAVVTVVIYIHHGSHSTSLA